MDIHAHAHAYLHMCVHVEVSGWTLATGAKGVHVAREECVSCRSVFSCRLVTRSWVVC